MVICVECSRPVNTTCKIFSPGSIRMTRCRCGKVADKYVEYEFTPILLDMLLLRHSVYRHLIFNRSYDGQEKQNSGMPSPFWKLLVAILFFSTLTKCQQYIDYNNFQIPVSYLNPHIIFRMSIFSIVELGLFIVGVVLAFKFYIGDRYSIIMWNHLVMTLILSSFGRTLYIILFIWKSLYNPQFVTLLQFFVICSNVSSMRVFAECSALQAAGMVMCGLLLQLGFQVIVHLLYPFIPITWL